MGRRAVLVATSSGERGSCLLAFGALTDTRLARLPSVLSGTDSLRVVTQYRRLLYSGGVVSTTEERSLRWSHLCLARWHSSLLKEWNGYPLGSYLFAHLVAARLPVLASH